MEISALVEQVESQLARCPQASILELRSANADAPQPIYADAPQQIAGELKPAPGIPLRIGAMCLSLLGAALSKLRRAEQQAYF
jgi:hypothetical protein